MTFSDFQIDIPVGRYKGEVKTLCPKCSHTRKKKTEKVLSVNLDKNTWFCFNCQWSGFLKNEPMEVKTFIKPVWKNNTTLSANAVKWFESRKIKQETLTHWKISEGMEWMPQENKEINTIQFNYFRNGELINTKYRGAKKEFKLVKDAELIFYGLDGIDFKQDVLLCEGEIDCLTIWQSGFKNVLSVPNGANLSKNNMSYFDAVSEKFFDCPKIYLCFDNDNAGRKLRYEFADRLGKDKCVFVEFKDCKDANDCLQKYDLQAIIESISQPKEFPLEGVYTISDISDEIDDMYVNGLEPGNIIGFDTFDQHLSFVRGYITTITGIPGHGKSDFLDEIILRLYLFNDWKTAFYSPENKPTKLHFSKLARKVFGKVWSGFNRINLTELNWLKNLLNNNIWFIKPENDFSVDSILNSVKQLKLKHGVDAFVIDAWNRLEHKDDSTHYIGKQLDKISDFCEKFNVHCFLVAHPTKIKKNKEGTKYEVPQLYDIAGSANFFNKTDNGISVYRDFETKNSIVYVQKVKFSHWGKQGQIEFHYDVNSGRYNDCLMPINYNSWIKVPGNEPTPLSPNNDFIEQTQDIIT